MIAEYLKHGVVPCISRVYRISGKATDNTKSTHRDRHVHAKKSDQFTLPRTQFNLILGKN